MTDYAIDVHGLVKHFGSKIAVDGVDIQMPKGQVWGFLGPNGSGKTTTIRMICGLLEPTHGDGTCLGYKIGSQSKQIKALTGYMTQKFSFWNDLTIRENLEFVARLYRMKNIRGAVDETLEGLNLMDRQNQLAGALSGGWKQRLALAAITMHRPRLLLLDEPTAGVDPQARREFWAQIHHLSTQGVTVLVSTHYMDEAERCDWIVYLANGKLMTQGTVADIISRSGLITFRAEGTHIRRLASALEGMPGVENVAYFGAALHVSGTDHTRLENSIRTVSNNEAVWEQVRPSLEDAFIGLMHEAGSDQRAHA